MIEIRNLYKSFPNLDVLKGIDLTINDNEIISIIGRSGIGKSVLLKNIIRLLEPDAGEIFYNGVNVTKLSKKELYKIRINFGFLFQNAALLDSINVEDNITLGLREHFSHTKAELSRIATQKLELVGLSGINHVMPSDLSGGMRKRVSLARAIAMNPKVILYDEPTTGLDPGNAEAIDNLILKLADHLKATSIVVTHDLASIYKLSDRIAMLDDGKIIFEGSVDDFRQSHIEQVKHFAYVRG